MCYYYYYAKLKWFFSFIIIIIICLTWKISIVFEIWIQFQSEEERFILFHFC